MFDERWIEWSGLQGSVATAVGTVTPATNDAMANGGDKLDVAATVRGMRHLRASVDRLPESQRSILVEECELMIGSINKIPATR